MSRIISLHDKATIANLLQRDTHLQLYALGDLDAFFWPYTNWYALEENGQLQHVVLAYTGTSVLTLHALSPEPLDRMRHLLRELLHLLPRTIYTHLSSGLADVFAHHYRIESHGIHDKMSLTNPSCLDGIDTSQVVALTPDDCAEVLAMYNASYPGNWFDPRMLETGQYFGIREHGELLSVAGVHVYSPSYRVAALGNITTRPDARGRGLAAAVTARLCRSLLEHVDHIGLNVKNDNTAAITCYRRLGFTRVADYGEYALELR